MDPNLQFPRRPRTANPDEPLDMRAFLEELFDTRLGAITAQMEALGAKIDGRCGPLEERVGAIEQKSDEHLAALEATRAEPETYRVYDGPVFDEELFVTTEPDADSASFAVDGLKDSMDRLDAAFDGLFGAIKPKPPACLATLEATRAASDSGGVDQSRRASPIQPKQEAVPVRLQQAPLPAPIHSPPQRSSPTPLDLGRSARPSMDLALDVVASHAQDVVLAASRQDPQPARASAGLDGVRLPPPDPRDSQLHRLEHGEVELGERHQGPIRVESRLHGPLGVDLHGEDALKAVGLGITATMGSPQIHHDALPRRRVTAITGSPRIHHDADPLRRFNLGKRVLGYAAAATAPVSRDAARRRRRYFRIPRRRRPPRHGRQPRRLPPQPPPESPHLLWPSGPGPGDARPNAHIDADHKESHASRRLSTEHTAEESLFDFVFKCSDGITKTIAYKRVVNSLSTSTVPLVLLMLGPAMSWPSLATPQLNALMGSQRQYQLPKSYNQQRLLPHQLQQPQTSMQRENGGMVGIKQKHQMGQPDQNGPSQMMHHTGGMKLEPLIPLEIALLSNWVQVQLSRDKSIEDLLSVLTGRYSTAVRLLHKNTHVNGTNLDHNLAILRSNVASAFTFRPDVAFVLTYTAEDGDNIMLDVVNDLLDACRTQQLNPLMILDKLAARDALSRESIARLLLFALDSELVLGSIVKEIQEDTWPVSADQRPSRCTRVAFIVVAKLLAACLTAQVRPIPWPSFIMSIECSMSWDISWGWKPP